MFPVFQKRLLDGRDDSVSKRPKLSTNVAYKHSSVVPRDVEVQKHRIFVGKGSSCHYIVACTNEFVVIDRKYEAIVLPIFGIPTPFHISTVKVGVALFWVM